MKLTIDLKNGTQLPACTVSRVEVMTDGSVRLYIDTPDVEIVADDQRDLELPRQEGGITAPEWIPVVPVGTREEFVGALKGAALAEVSARGKVTSGGKKKDK